MKKLVFNSPTAQKIYDDYFKRVQRCISILSAADQQDMLMELNSHVYEGTQSANLQNEVDALMDVLTKLGMPEEVLQPVVAARKARQAARTFNPKHVLQAIILNVSNGIGYTLLGIVYLVIFGFAMITVLKIIFPSNTGLFAKDGHLVQFGYSGAAPAHATELLGIWFIPITAAVVAIAYLLNTMLLRLLRRKQVSFNVF
jgi:uncharacterized membrane protein